MAKLPDQTLVTSLTVTPVDADGLRYLHLTEADERDLTFDAGAVVTAVTTELQLVRSRQTIAEATVGESDGPITAVALATPIATVTLSGAALAIGEVYELLVTFTGASDTWTKTLPVERVA